MHHSAKPQLIGYILSLVLTALTFAVVLYTTVPMTVKITLVLVLAILQLLVQLIYFMHIGESEKVYNVINISFAIFVAITVVAGSIWIMSFHSAHLI
jgi:cytochrome aa3 quinol oxidase subunit IV